MNKNNRPRASRRLLASTALGAALAAGLVAAAMPANAAPQRPVPSNGHAVNWKQPKLGARKTPFSPKTTTAAIAPAGVTPADAADHPWAVGIVDNIGSYVVTCTGTVISPTKVLTSARCDTGQSFAGTTVIAGRDNLEDDSVGFVDSVASTWTDPGFVYPNYGNGMGANVEVLTLSQPLPSVYTPISLSAQGDESPYGVGTSATTYGYQWTNNKDGLNYPYLAQAPVTIQNGSACHNLNLAYPANDEVCAGFTDGAAHDSTAFNMGSPLIAGGKQIGIADRLTDSAATQVAFERTSIVHNDVTADLNRPAPNNADWYGDGISDIVGEGFDGSTTIYQGLGANPATNAGFSLQTSFDYGYNWNTNYERLLRVSDFDGNPDAHGVLAVEYNGILDYYSTDQWGDIDHSSVTSVGLGWNQFSNIIPINNFAGDGNLALIAERPDGSLWLYEHNAKGWLNGNGVEIGSGFNKFTDLMAFQWTNDGHVGLLGYQSGGLVFYPVDGSGHWTNGNGQLIGYGFSNLIRVFSVGSFGGSDTGSVMTVDQAGDLKVYQANGDGGWLTGNGVRIGVGFQTLKTVF